jgi:signal transduction histidine kinase
MLERVRHSARHMNQLIDDLMQLSRINQGLQDVFEVDLSSMAQEIFDNLKERAPERKVTLSLDGKLRAAGDPNMLSILLTNLIENAWKFTSGKPEARIEFGRCLSGGAETFFIRDNGAGFDMAFSEKLFKPFERLHSAAEFAGTGIGLATVSRIVKHHRGRVWAESSPGQGATFFFQLGLKVPRGGIKPVRKPDRERGPRGDAAHEGHPPLLRTGTG